MRRCVTGSLLTLSLVLGSVSASAWTNAPHPPPAVAYAIERHFPRSQWWTARQVSNCESSWREYTGTTTNVGLFQINVVHKKLVASMGYTWAQVSTQAGPNAAVADRLRRGSPNGWAGPWASPCDRRAERSRPPPGYPR